MRSALLNGIPHRQQIEDEAFHRALSCYIGDVLNRFALAIRPVNFNHAPLGIDQPGELRAVFDPLPLHATLAERRAPFGTTKPLSLFVTIPVPRTSFHPASWPVIFR